MIYNFFGALRNYMIQQKANTQQIQGISPRTTLLNHTFYYCSYPKYMKWGWKHDRNPLILCLYSNMRHTHGLNLHYLSPYEISTVFQMLRSYYRYMRTTSWYQFYHTFFKANSAWNNLIIRKCYRKYMTNLLYGYVVSNGIWKTSSFARIYRSPNPYVTAQQAQFNKEFGLDDVSAAKAQQAQKAQQLFTNSMAKTAAQTFKGIKSWISGITSTNTGNTND